MKALQPGTRVLVRPDDVVAVVERRQGRSYVVAVVSAYGGGRLVRPRAALEVE